MGKIKLFRWFASFLGIILLFTVISRGAASVTTAQIQTGFLQNQVVVHAVKGSGKTEGTKERAVFVQEGQKIEQVFVQEGDAVNKGDVLLKFSLKYLKKTAQEKEDQLSILRNKEQDFLSGQAVNDSQKASDQKRAQDNYNLAVRNGDMNIANARQEIQIARERLSQFYSSQEFTDTPGDRSEEQALCDDLRMKEQNLNTVIANTNEAVLQAARAVEDAKRAQASDSTSENIQIEIANAQEELEELQKLIRKKGEIKSPVNGVVKTIQTETGGQSGGDAAIVLYESEGNLRLKGTISREDLKYVEVGGVVQINGPDGTALENGTVESIAQNDSDETLYTVYMTMPDASVSVGTTVTFTISAQTGPFHSCVPVSALNEEKGEYFVYVTDTRETVLGEVLVARRVAVAVRDKNGAVAALEDGAVSTDQKIIVYSDREITDGSRVRLQES